MDQNSTKLISVCAWFQKYVLIFSCWEKELMRCMCPFDFKKTLFFFPIEWVLNIKGYHFSDFHWLHLCCISKSFRKLKRLRHAPLEHNRTSWHVNWRSNEDDAFWYLSEKNNNCWCCEGVKSYILISSFSINTMTMHICQFMNTPSHKEESNPSGDQFKYKKRDKNNKTPANKANG